MTKAEAERQRSKVHAKAKRTRDVLLTAQANIPSLVAEMNEVMEITEPPKAEAEKEDT